MTLNVFFSPFQILSAVKNGDDIVITFSSVPVVKIYCLPDWISLFYWPE